MGNTRNRAFRYSFQAPKAGSVGPFGKPSRGFVGMNTDKQGSAAYCRRQATPPTVSVSPVKAQCTVPPFEAFSKSTFLPVPVS